MIITVQGMNHKNNKAVQTVSTLAGMDSLINGNKTLIVQLINPDIDTADNTLNKNTDIAYGIAKNSFAETGIDSLLRICAGTVLGTTEFEQFCTPMRRTKFALDVAEISKNVEFTKTLANRIEDIKEILTAAAEVYQNVYVLVDSKDDDLLKIVNEMDIVNRSVYCLRQGHMTKGDVYGKNILYVVTDFHGDSEFSMKSMKNAYVSKREPIYPLTFNIRATDAAMKGRLLYFLLRNTEVGKTDVNFTWFKDVQNILSGIGKMREAKEPHVKKDLDSYKKDAEIKDFSMFTENTPLSPPNDVIESAHEEPLLEETEPVKKPKKHSGLFAMFSKPHKSQKSSEILDKEPNLTEAVVGLEGIAISDSEDVEEMATEETPVMVDTKPGKKASVKKNAPKKPVESDVVAVAAETKKTTSTVSKAAKTTAKKSTGVVKKATVKKTTVKGTAEEGATSNADLATDTKKEDAPVKKTATVKKAATRKTSTAKNAAEATTPKTTAKKTRATTTASANNTDSNEVVKKPTVKATATKKAAKPTATAEEIQTEVVETPKATKSRKTKKVEA